MLWLTGSICLILWFVLAVVLHKSGMVHGLLLATLSLYVTQFVQDRRTRAYKAERR